MLNEKNLTLEFYWFLVYLAFFILAGFILSKIQKHEKFADLRKNKKFRDPNYSILIFAIFLNKEDPLRKSGILFSKIVLLFQILLIFVPAIVITIIYIIFFSKI